MRLPTMTERTKYTWKRYIASALAGVVTWFTAFWGLSYISYKLSGDNIHGDLFFVGMFASPILGIAVVIILIRRRRKNFP